MTLTRNEAEAEDLVQETYLRAPRSFYQLRPGSNLKSWIFTILRNVQLNQVRHSQSKTRVGINEPVVDVGEFEDKSSKDLFGSYLTKVTQADARKAIDNLPAAYREVILLREFEGLSYGGLAEALDSPAGTVMSNLSRARETLKAMLQSRWEERAMNWSCACQDLP